MQTNRRTFLKAAGSLLVSTAVSPGCDSGKGKDEPARTIQLTPQWITTTLDQLTVRLRTYDGSLPGPLLTFTPGETVQITIDNQLTPYDSSAWTGDHNVPHALNTTNLHLHGMDVIPHLFEPQGTSDPSSSMIAIEPGASYTYEFEIPEDHPAGFFWYHPHHHGSTAVQAVSGMAGPIVIRGAIDEVPEIAAAKEQMLIFSDLGLFEAEDGSGDWVYEPEQNAIWSTTDGKVYNYVPDKKELPLKGGFSTGDYRLRFYAVNGTPFFREDHNDADWKTPITKQLTPLALTMQPGEVVRLRLLNACSDLVMPLILAGMDTYLIAMDGTNFLAPRRLDTADVEAWTGEVTYNEGATSLVLGPGNRAELLIRASTAGSYELVQLAHTGQQFLPAERKVIASITIQGDTLEMGIPTVLPDPGPRRKTIPEADVVETRSFQFMMKFSELMNPAVGLDLMLGIVEADGSMNEDLYEEHMIDTTAQVGTAETWILQSPKHTAGNGEGHPFHVHVNPMQIQTIAGVAQTEGTFLDTVWVGVDQEVEARIRFEGWTGKTVYHCHILPHEDTGMMRNLLIA